MEKAKVRIEVFYKITDPRAQVIRRRLERLNLDIQQIYLSNNYLFNIDLNKSDAVKIAESLTQNVTQSYIINAPFLPPDFTHAIEIGFLPGVTDNVAHTVMEMIHDSFKDSGKINIDREKSVFTTITYFIKGSISHDDARKISMELYNPLIEHMKIMSRSEYISNNGMGMGIPIVHISERPDADEVNLNVSDKELIRLGKEGIQEKDGTRRGPLALDLLFISVIKNYFNDIEKRNPTDIELESIAQTWSEHCKHTIFASKLDEIDEGIFKKYIRAATDTIRKIKGARDFCLSVFEDNAGGIAFDDNYIVADKVETHNSPSALDPFGGAVTGIVGVNRDAIGFGMGAKPIANRYGFCFADPWDEKPLYRQKSKDSQLLSPRRIMDGVIHGVNVGGNQSGIPTPQGFVYFDERYKGKPLVFVGTVGLLPRTINGASSVEKKAMPGDCIVMAGGRVGRDGIHGATFSSEALDSGSPAAAVQIGDPITQKKLSDAIVKSARDKGLYNSITDNGAGGLSCSVAEMAKECGGFDVDLDKVPLKYPGLAPWQIWVSESQERMTLSVPQDKISEFFSLMKMNGVEAAVIGTFNGSGRGKVKYYGKTVFDLDMDFLHNGLPKRTLYTDKKRKENEFPDFPEKTDYTTSFHAITGRLNTAGFEFISAQYDHEVQANSVIKPLQGKGRINGNASVIRPVLESPKGVVLSQSLYPSFSDIDTYWMAACSIDTAIRNALSVGGSLEKLALLDNFCWCDSNNPERLDELKDAAKACYDFAVANGTPFVSGKDSMFNDFKGYDENFNGIFISVPPTLLISSFGIVEDVLKCQTIDFKFPGDLIYILGETGDELGGSEYHAYICESVFRKKYVHNSIPKVDPDKNIALYKALEKAFDKELLASSISIERGGLAIAIAKSSMAGLFGFNIDIAKMPAVTKLRKDTLLYSESQGRLLVSVNPSNKKAFEDIFKNLPFACLGKVSKYNDMIINFNDIITIKTDVDSMLKIYKGRFEGF
ncbi:MAG: phosphoribosylformylglycinamidine synthase [Spirochaetes bacterium]|nr:phosphoribosylformylglycinamidine synthase [Spirochaetota bacterium]